jgi:hypothetical protein
VKPSAIPWYRQTGYVVLALVFCFPLGLALMWINRLWSHRTRLILSAIGGIFVIIAVAMPAPRRRSNDAPPRTAPPAQPKTPSGAQPSSATATNVVEQEAAPSSPAPVGVPSTSAPPRTAPPAQPQAPSGAQPSSATATRAIEEKAAAASSAPVEVPPYEIVRDDDLAPKSGHGIYVNVKNPDLTDAQCAAIIARLRPRAGREGVVSVRIPLHNERPAKHFYPLCYDNLDGEGVQEGTVRQLQRAVDQRPNGRDGK